MIISASRRTDIPCYYSEWFMQRIRAGYALTRNPMNYAQLSRVALTPDAVDCFVFWTKDAANILPRLDELEEHGYPYYFQFTLTPYERGLEPGLRPKSEIIETLIKLSKRIGRERVVWRYDPVILNGDIDIAYHMAHFERMCSRLAAYTDTVTISFVDLYRKLKTPLIRAITEGETAELSGFFGRAARNCGLRATACCESGDLGAYGIGRASCIDAARIERITGRSLALRADRNQRRGCSCFESVDIGAYDTCPGGCVYCYANQSHAKAASRFAAHDARSELLFGSVAQGERITDRK